MVTVFCITIGDRFQAEIPRVMQTTLTALAVITVGYILAYLAPDIMRRLLWEVSKAVLAGLRGGGS